MTVKSACLSRRVFRGFSKSQIPTVECSNICNVHALKTSVNIYTTSACERVHLYWFFAFSVLIHTQDVCCICNCVQECARLSEFIFSHASICLIIPETGTHHTVGSWGIQSRSATFISQKTQTEGTYVAVFSILHKIKKNSVSVCKEQLLH